MSIPVFANDKAFSPNGGRTSTAEELRQKYGKTNVGSSLSHTVDTGAIPLSDSADVMTVNNVVAKTAFAFITLLAGAVLGWFMPGLMWVGLIVGLIFGLILSFKRQPSAPLTLLYSASQGLALGGLSMYSENLYSGVVPQAVMATLIVTAVVLALFSSGKLRTSPRMTKIFFIATFSIIGYGLLNLILSATGVVKSSYGLDTSITIFGMPLGIIVGLLAILMACYSFVMDFEYIQNGVENRLPEKYGWQSAFGLMATLVWLYVEILRVLSILREISK